MDWDVGKGRELVSCEGVLKHDNCWIELLPGFWFIFKKNL